jgi:hypothetical protein
MVSSWRNAEPRKRAPSRVTFSPPAGLSKKYWTIVDLEGVKANQGDNAFHHPNREIVSEAEWRHTGLVPYGVKTEKPA